MEPFGGLAISFRQLLQNLEHVCGCSVVQLSEINEILDVKESAAGALYEVSRYEGPAFWYAHIEVYSYDLPVLPDVIRSVCQQLDLSIERVMGRRLH